MKTFYLLKISVILLVLASSVQIGFAFKIDSIKVEYNKKQLVLPGEKFSISVISYHSDGKIRKTRGVQGGNISWRHYDVLVSGGVLQGGKIFVNEKLIPSFGKYIKVAVTPKKHPELKQDILIPLNYEISLEFIPEEPYSKSPGSIIEGSILSVYDNGISRVTEKLRTENQINSFRFETSGGHWEKGKFNIDPDFLNIENHTAALVKRLLHLFHR